MPSFHKLAAFSAILGAFAIASSDAQAAASTWDHNGSAVRLDENGKKRTFVYDDPRGTLTSAGVKRGTVLFDGEEKADGRLAGYAKLFRKGCDPVDYFVEGSYDKQKGEVLLQGQAPIYAGNGCKITGYSDDGGASSLSFRRMGGSGDYVAGADEDSADPRSGRPGYLPPSTLPRSSQSSQDDRGYEDRYGSERTYGSSRDPRYDGRNDPAQDGAAQGYGQRNNGQSQYGQQGSDPRYDSRPGYPSRQYGSQYSDDPDYGRGAYPRDYAARRNYYRRFDYYGYPADPDATDDEPRYEEDDPGYVPYQPRWRRY